jgi:hypothetical protein
MAEGTAMTGRAGQVPTERVSLVAIMRTPAFAHGLRDARAGRPFDASYGGGNVDGAWNYERGRAFGKVAPRAMALWIGDRINPAAVRLCTQRGVIL